MITYDCMREGWVRDNDATFFVDMTPEGEENIYDLSFSNEEDFWKWYNTPCSN